MVFSTLNVNPQPKLLTRIEVATALTLSVDISNAAQFDTNVSIVIPAGNYFLSSDAGADDLVHILADEFSTKTIALGVSPLVTCYILADNRFVINFWDDNYVGSFGRDIRINWDTGDGPTIAAYLGFDSSAADTSTGVDNPVFTGDYQHGYCWYADDVGYIAKDLPYLTHKRIVLQSKAPSGHVKTIEVGGTREGLLGLQHLPTHLMYSDNVGYGSTPVGAFDPNEALECWYLAVIDGTPFRYYRNGLVSTEKVIETGVSDAGSSSTVLTDSAKSWVVNELVGSLLYIPTFSVVGVPLKAIILSNTATTITIASYHGGIQTLNLQTYYVLDHTYETVILDGSSSVFEPTEHESLAIYNHEFTFINYVS